MTIAAPNNNATAYLQRRCYFVLRENWRILSFLLFNLFMQLQYYAIKFDNLKLIYLRFNCYFNLH